MSKRPAKGGKQRSSSSRGGAPSGGGSSKATFSNKSKQNVVTAASASAHRRRSNKARDDLSRIDVDGQLGELQAQRSRQVEGNGKQQIQTQARPNRPRPDMASTLHAFETLMN